jgi:hypothetical protein
MEATMGFGREEDVRVWRRGGGKVGKHLGEYEAVWTRI